MIERVGIKTIKPYVFAKKLKLVFKKVLAFLDLSDPLVQIHVSVLRIASSRRATMENGTLEREREREEEEEEEELRLIIWRV